MNMLVGCPRSKIPQIRNLTNYYNTLTLGKLKFDYFDLNVVESCTNRQDVSEELLAVVLAPADDTVSRFGMVHMGWQT